MRKVPDIRVDPYIIDTTLRDGEQTPGVVFSPGEKMKIAELLDSLGVQEVEAGTPAIGCHERDAIREISSAGFSFLTSCWCRATAGDIQMASKLGTQAINISLPVSDVQISTLNKTRSWVLKELPRAIEFARQYFPHVTMGAQDASRANPDFLNTFISLASEAGAGRIRIADTVGLLDPQETYNLLLLLNRTFPEVQFEFHGHNDLGMATANAIMAIKAGTKCISATVNGLGERAGNSALEEILAYMQFKMEDLRYNTREINQLCSYVSGITESSIPVNKAITGKNAFRHESGIHTSSIIRNVNSYQILNPLDFGVSPTSFSFGKHSGKNAIIHFFKSLDYPINGDVAAFILKKMKSDVNINKHSVSKDDMKVYYFEAMQLCS